MLSPCESRRRRSLTEWDGCLNSETIPRLRCSIVAGSANNQLETPQDADRLHERGILYAPDYIINAGGIINVYVELEEDGYVEKRALERIATIYDNLKLVFEIARTKDVNTRRAAAHLAEMRIEKAKAEA